MRSMASLVGVLLVLGSTTSLMAQDEPRGRRPEAGPEGMRMRMMMAVPVMQALDLNGDGELSAKEIESATASLKKLDKNKDGKLSAEELRPNFPPMGGPGGFDRGAVATAMVDRMMAFDKNGDGKLAKSELPERLVPLMDRADTNKDGFLDREELTALARRQAQQGGPGGGGPGRFGPREGAPRDGQEERGERRRPEAAPRENPAR